MSERCISCGAGFASYGSTIKTCRKCPPQYVDGKIYIPPAGSAELLAKTERRFRDGVNPLDLSEQK
jgi:hypothetical protein